MAASSVCLTVIQNTEETRAVRATHFATYIIPITKNGISTDMAKPPTHLHVNRTLPRQDLACACGLVIKRHIGAYFLEEFDLLIRTGGSNDFETFEFGDLDNHAAIREL
jgi:hypothetical protein